MNCTRRKAERPCFFQYCLILWHFPLLTIQWSSLPFYFRILNEQFNADLWCDFHFDLCLILNLSDTQWWSHLLNPWQESQMRFPETKLFTPSCSSVVHEDVFYSPSNSDLSPFVLQDCVAVSFTSFGEKLITGTGLVFSFQSDDCAVIQYTAHEILKHFHTKPVSAFFLVPVKIVLLQAFCFTEGEKNPLEQQKSAICIPAKRQEMALRLQCNFRLWKWNWLHGGRKGGEKMEKKKNYCWNIFSLSLLVLITSPSSGLIAFNVKYMFNIEIVKT